MKKKTIQRKVKAWMGFTDGKPYFAYDERHDNQEYCIYKTRRAAKDDFEDVRPCTITYQLPAPKPPKVK